MVLCAEEFSQKIARLRGVWHTCAGNARPLLVILDFDRTITTADRFYMLLRALRALSL